MTNYLSDEMIDRVKILILYILKDIEIKDIRKLIWEKIFNFEDELLNTEWIEQWLENIDFDGRYYYSDWYYSD